MRIGILGFAHESNTFVSVPTTLQRFSERGICRGREIIDRWKGSHHELGGFVAGSEADGFEVVPLMTANATPGGPLTTAAFETILDEALGLLEEEELDGLLLALHGAMVAEGYPDADGEIVSRIRKVLGDKLIVMTLDCHANVSSKMVDNVTATVMYRTNPHVDQRERGLEAAALIARTVRGQIHPVQALERPPMVINISKQYTSQQPAMGLIQDAEHVMRQPGVLSASVGLGFAFADVEKMGTSFV
ncbi:MAG: M81 family metallopeptidase, partial [Candidatus Bathyarchaeota archaeon]|nr:M81 family metallopeptidase [Candidatus Bathyarchaeota archaeon]